MKPSGIGGQAVIEGIMMRNNGVYSVAVRKPDKEIEVKIEKTKMLTEKYKFLNLPIIRGVFNFVDSLVMGIKTLTYSSSFYEEDEEDTKVDEVGKAVFKDRFESVLMALTVVVSIALAVGIFMVLPYFISRLLSNVIASKTILNVVEGIVRIAIFVGYMLLISLMNDIKRVFMYHGAEHKCINCIENGLELTIANVRKSSKEHKRCGTSFMLLVMFVSVIFFIFIHMDNPVLQVVVRLLLVPVIAGVSYEIIRWAGRHDNVFVNIISKPGLLMQKLSTKEPTDDMIEVAIEAVEAVFDWQDFLARYDSLEDYPCDKVEVKPGSALFTVEQTDEGNRKVDAKAARAAKEAKKVKEKAEKESAKTSRRNNHLEQMNVKEEEIKAAKREMAKLAATSDPKAMEREFREARREICIARMEEELTHENYEALPDALEDYDSVNTVNNSNPLAEETEEFAMDIPTFKKRDRKK